MMMWMLLVTLIVTVQATPVSLQFSSSGYCSAYIEHADFTVDKCSDISTFSAEIAQLQLQGDNLLDLAVAVIGGEELRADVVTLTTSMFLPENLNFFISARDGWKKPCITPANVEWRWGVGNVFTTGKVIFYGKAISAEGVYGIVRFVGAINTPDHYASAVIWLSGYFDLRSTEQLVASVNAIVASGGGVLEVESFKLSYTAIFAVPMANRPTVTTENGRTIRVIPVDQQGQAWSFLQTPNGLTMSVVDSDTTTGRCVEVILEGGEPVLYRGRCAKDLKVHSTAKTFETAEGLDFDFNAAAWPDATTKRPFTGTLLWWDESSDQKAITMEVLSKVVTSYGVDLIVEIKKLEPSKVTVLPLPPQVNPHNDVSKKMTNKKSWPIKVRLFKESGDELVGTSMAEGHRVIAALYRKPFSGIPSSSTDVLDSELRDAAQLPDRFEWQGEHWAAKQSFGSVEMGDMFDCTISPKNRVFVTLLNENDVKSEIHVDTK